MNLYEAVFYRKSVRRYKDEKIPGKLLCQIKSFYNKIVPLDSEIKTDIEILERKDNISLFKGLFVIDAPYYLVLFSEEKNGFEKNGGYIMENLVLYLLTKGLGSCYMGAAKALIADKPGMKQLLIVAFGYPSGNLLREPAKAKRLSLKELCISKEETDDTIKSVLKAARMAPSAFNLQPWRFIAGSSKIHIFECRELMHGMRTLSHREINMGIMMSHIALAAEEMWMDVSFEYSDKYINKKYKSGRYFITVRFS